MLSRVRRSPPLRTLWELLGDAEKYIWRAGQLKCHNFWPFWLPPSSPSRIIWGQCWRVFVKKGFVTPNITFGLKLFCTHMSLPERCKSSRWLGSTCVFLKFTVVNCKEWSEIKAKTQRPDQSEHNIRTHLVVEKQYSAVIHTRLKSARHLSTVSGKGPWRRSAKRTKPDAKRRSKLTTRITSPSSTSSHKSCTCGNTVTKLLNKN